MRLYIYISTVIPLTENILKWNRGALWPSNYANSSTYSFIATLNKVNTDFAQRPVTCIIIIFKFRNFLVNGTDSWTTTQAEVLASTSNEIAILKGRALSIMTNIGSPVSLRVVSNNRIFYRTLVQASNTSFGVSTPWATGTPTLE